MQGLTPFLFAACAAVGPGIGGVTLDPDGEPAQHARRVAERARGAEVIYLGESHDNPAHHQAQALVLESMVTLGARPAVAFEMLPEGDQTLVDETLLRAEDATDAGRRLGWRARGWPDFAMYWPLFDLARRHRLPVVAADLDPGTTRRVAREGLGAFGEGGGRLASRLPPDPAREAAIAQTIHRAHCDLLPADRLPRMVESWHARNVTIARRLAETLGRSPQVVVIIGRGHQDPGGVPAQLEAWRPGTRQLVVALVEADPGEPASAAARHVSGDVVWVTPSRPRSDPCAGLRQRLPGPTAGLAAAAAGPGAPMAAGTPAVQGGIR